MVKKDDRDLPAAQRIRLDFSYAMSDFVTPDHGISRESIESLKSRIVSVHKEIMAKREQNLLGFYDLPYGEKDASKLAKAGRRIGKSCRNFVVLGIGGSALGGMALHRALNHPQHNLLPESARKGKPRILFADNIDPDGFNGILDLLDPEETIFNVISKSGGTAETMSQFLYIRDKLTRKLGKESHRSHVLITTDPEKGNLREIADREGYERFQVPPAVGGRFSALSAVGLLPAAVVGIDVVSLLAGARDMDGRCKNPNVWQNPAYMNGTMYYLADVEKKKNIVVMMPYADSLYSVADWFRQLWAESLGKKLDLKGKPVWTGQTPVSALGATDQHSQLQLYMEGPNDKIITFLVVEKFRTKVAIPRAFRDMKGLAYLGGHSLNELISIEQKSSEVALTRNNRPNNTIVLPEINPFTIGQLLMMLEIQTVFAGGLYGVNPLDQPGVEEGKQFAYGLMGRSGFEEKRAEFEARPKKNEKYFI
ncbi:MAG: glucose-6-phosphate isomerase [Pseudomonadota bacterium]